MRFKSIFAVLSGMAFACFAIYACQKDIVKQDGTSIPLKLEGVAARSTSVHKITCVGSCQTGEHPDPNESTCEAMLYDGNTGTIECPCTNCVMQVSSQLTRVNPYLQYFNEHLTVKIGTVTTILYSVEIEEYTNADVIIFEYKIPNTSNRETVMYIKRYNAAGEPTGPVVEIDCSGGCDNATETCRERYILSTGDAECTCQGTCKMTVTYKQ